MKNLFFSLGCILLLGFGAPTLYGQSARTQTANQVCPILNGSELPEGMLLTAEGKEFNIRKEIEKQPTVLLVYRGGWCPYCNRHLAEVQDAEAELVEMGYRILAISPDQPSALAESMDKEKLNFTLLSDSKLEYLDQLGLGFQVDDATLKKYKNWDIDLEKASGETHHRLPVPAAFIINHKGFITFSYLNPNYKTRVDASVLLAAARAGLKK